MLATSTCLYNRIARQQQEQQQQQQQQLKGKAERRVSASAEMNLVKPISEINADGEPRGTEQRAKREWYDRARPGPARPGPARAIRRLEYQEATSTGLRAARAPYRATYENEKVDNIWIDIWK